MWWTGGIRLQEGTSNCPSYPCWYYQNISQLCKREREVERERERGGERETETETKTETKTECWDRDKILLWAWKNNRKAGKTAHCFSLHTSLFKRNTTPYAMQHITTDSQGSQNLYLSGDSDMSFLMSGSASGASRTTGRVCSSAPETSKCMWNITGTTTSPCHCVLNKHSQCKYSIRL